MVKKKTESDPNDLSVDGPGSPASLKKFLAWEEKNNPGTSGQLKVIIDHGAGIVKDDPDTVVITPEDCKKQAEYFLDNIFSKTPGLPYYAIRHIGAMYALDGYDYFSKTRKYLDNESVKMAIMTNSIKKEDEDVKFFLNKFKYGKSDSEFMQILGLIQLLSGAFKKGCRRIFVDYPETYLHPKRERILVCMFEAIKKEYGLPNRFDKEIN